MKRVIVSLLLLAGFAALSTMEASAVVCARGVYRAGCVGAGGAELLSSSTDLSSRRGGPSLSGETSTND
jgi:hypothetical protein